MKDKVLIELYIVELNRSFDVRIPANEYVGKIVDNIIASAFELTDSVKEKENYYLINPETGVVYSNNSLVRDTDIRNAKKVFVI